MTYSTYMTVTLGQLLHSEDRRTVAVLVYIEKIHNTKDGRIMYKVIECDEFDFLKGATFFPEYPLEEVVFLSST